MTLVGLATVAIVIFATRAGMAIHHDTIEILHLIGAKDSFIASQFQRHFLARIEGWADWRRHRGALASGLSRLSFGLEDALIPKLTFSVTLVVALLPLFASLLTMITARQTVTSTWAGWSDRGGEAIWPAAGTQTPHHAVEALADPSPGSAASSGSPPRCRAPSR